ncbi:MAG: LysR family transcriptional regulator [Gammaproteobacteria bacterium]|nr:MAG: LysR family transcriptional regulator [Gammaproteobacteria bacterium]
MHLTLRQLRVFESVARNLSYTRAAEELHLSQPAVSMQIKQLEENLGLPLFEQLGKKVFLTEAGTEMYHYSRTVDQQLNEAEAVLEDLKGLRRGRLVIAVASTANYFVPRLFAEFNKRHEGLSLSLDVTNRAGLISHLDANDTDMVIMGLPPAGKELDAEAFLHNPLVIIAASDHPLVSQSSIPMKSLRKETFIMREQGSGTRISMQRVFKDRGLELRADMEMSSNEAIKQAVEAGLGLGIVSLHTLQLELAAGCLAVLDVQDFPVMRHWYMVNHKSKRLSPVARAFREFVLAEADSLIQSPLAVGSTL